MKALSLFTLLTILFATVSSAQAGYVERLKKKTWAQLRADWDLDFENDQIWFGGKMMSVFDTCMASASQIRTLKKVKIEEYDGEDFYTVGYDYLYRSVRSTRPMVDGDGTVDVPYSVATSRMIRVVYNDDDFDGDYLFSKRFTIPSCR